jgi:matrixin
MADQQWYPAGTRPRVLINWNSFVAEGIPNDWQGPFTEAVINAYTRWQNIAGVDLRFQFYGYTTKTNSDDGELVISMNRLHHPNESRLASTFGQYNRLIIVFHRRNGDGTPWNFVPRNALAGEIEMQGVLTHELGHCLGLDHGTDPNATMFPNYNYHSTRFGPFNDDINRVRVVYPSFTRNRVRQLRSGDGGNSWAEITNELTSHGHVNTRTNANPGVAALPQSGLYVIGWSHTSGIPTWLRTDGDRFVFRNWLFYGGERSIYGPAYASDNNQTSLWAWVTNDDRGTIKVVRSRNQAFQWHLVNTPANARTAGTPALCWTRVNGQSHWILAWSNFDRTNQNDTGFVHASISTNDGSNWSAPVVLDRTFKALSGVSAATTPSNRIEIAFAWAPDNAANHAGINAIRTFVCDVSGGQVRRLSVIASSERTRIQPALAYEARSNRFVMAWREQNFATSLNIAHHPATGGAWSPLIRPGQSSNTAPALAASQEYGEVVLWYGYE